MHPRSSVVLSFVSITCVLACSDVGNTSNPEVGQVVEDFQLLNSRGEVTTAFTQADTVVFLYRLHNQTGRDLTVGMAHGGPLVNFTVCQDSQVIRDSFAGYVFPSNAPSYLFRAGQIFQERWTVSASSFFPRQYTASAKPQMVVLGIGIPSERSITFHVQ